MSKVQEVLSNIIHTSTSKKYACEYISKVLAPTLLIVRYTYRLASREYPTKHRINAFAILVSANAYVVCWTATGEQVLIIYHTPTVQTQMTGFNHGKEDTFRPVGGREKHTRVTGRPTIVVEHTTRVAAHDHLSNFTLQWCRLSTIDAGVSR